MTKKLNINDSKKMLKIRDEKRKLNCGLILQIWSWISIWADRYQLILKIDWEDNSYYSYNSLDRIIEDLLYRRAILSMIKSEKKDMDSLARAFTDCKLWSKDVLAPLLCPFTSKSISKLSCPWADSSESDSE